MKTLSPKALLRLHVFAFALNLVALGFSGWAWYRNRQTRQRIEALILDCDRLEQQLKQPAK